MRMIARHVIGLAAVLLLAGSSVNAVDGVSFNSARVGATNPQALAKFYEQALGLKEVNRLTFPNMVEIMMNFGATVDAAKQNPGAQIVIVQVKHVDARDTVPHLIFNVTDMTGTVAALKAAGGKVTSAPQEFGKTGIVFAMAIDPAGNHIELIKMPKK
jgi:predicted enzyme related to lactoylglutathione lyase